LQALRLQREETNLDQSIDEDLAGGSAGTGNVNTDAERTLLRIKLKLQGYEYGEALNVHGQVNQLIQEAQDPERLCKMFPGWAPWV
jgi:ataxia telangiectasia mutated family protein